MARLKGLTEPHYKEADDSYWPGHKERRSSTRAEWRESVRPFGHPDFEDSAFQDAQVADEAIATMERAVESGKPFFIAPGFKKPHLPFVCPKRYYDLYESERIELSPHPELDSSQDPMTVTVAKWGASKWFNYRETGISDLDARELRHHYYACVSFIDAQVGKLMAALDRLGVADRTIVVFWSDHGFHLGDHGIWTKQTNYELATRAPLIVRAPGMQAVGESCYCLVEYVDLYPTLCELAGFGINPDLEGSSFVPLLNDPEQPWKTAAFSQFPRGNQTEGYSIRTAEWRYTEWRDKRAGEIVSRKLYHTAEDPLETRNLADESQFQERMVLMQQRLKSGWENARPIGANKI